MKICTASSSLCQWLIIIWRKRAYWNNAKYTNSRYPNEKGPPTMYKCKYMLVTHTYKGKTKKKKKSRRRKKKRRSYCFQYYKPLNLGFVWHAHIHTYIYIAYQIYFASNTDAMQSHTWHLNGRKIKAATTVEQENSLEK